MLAFIDAAFDRTRTVVMMLLFLLIAGAVSYMSIAKEANPDVAIPVVYVHVTHDGIAPGDSERLLVRPLEKELQSIEGLKELKGTAGEGYASVLLEFDAGFDSKKALTDVREKVDDAKTKFPTDAEEPSVNEVNVALFPIISISLSGPVPEQALLRVASQLKDALEALPGVLEVDVGGDRDEMMEVIVDPIVMETYQVRYDDLINLVSANNMLVAAGAVDTGSGRMVLKVPGVIEDIEDVLSLPVKVTGDAVVTFGDVAQIRRTYKDRDGFARIGGQPGVVLEVKKRIGENIINTIDQVRYVVEEGRKLWPESIQVRYMQDQSEQVKDMLKDLQNNVMSAIILVMVVIIAALGLRSAMLVGLAIPGSFLTGILVLYWMGHTLNIVTLFSLILVVGMLVDGAIVVIELADRKMGEGLTPKLAYAHASKRMFWPIGASTATTLAVFFPLLFWPGVMGQFMKYLPLTVIICLSASLFMALVFVPVVGGTLGRKKLDRSRQAELLALETGDYNQAKGMTGVYVKFLGLCVRWPGTVFLLSLVIMVGTYMAYGKFGKGVEFFPEIEPEFAQVQIHARGDLSVYEKDDVVRKVESRILDMSELKVVYARTFAKGGGNNRAEDLIGVIQLELTDWDKRRPAVEILEEMRQRNADVAGVYLEFRKQEDGPGGDNKPIEVQVTASDTSKIDSGVAHIRRLMDEIGGYDLTEDDRALPGIEWRIEVDRELAARNGASVALLGNAIKMITTGIKLADYRPDDTDEEVDILVRFPFGERRLDQLDQLRVPTNNGMVPISNFVKVTPAPKTGTLQRVGAKRVITVKSDVKAGELVDAKVKALQKALEEQPLPDGVTASFKGEDEEQKETGDFLMMAFVIAIFLMAMTLVTQFNSLYQAFLVLSAIVFSTAGVLLGLLITQQPFGIVMVGVGIIALAGIVVNNNIVLIDSYNVLRAEGRDPIDAAVRTGALRLRPVLLTAMTTILGLMPMVLSLNIDFVNRSYSVGAPSTQWWTQLSSAIAGGLFFATGLTLVLTPCLLVLGEKLFFNRRRAKQAKKAEREAQELNAVVS